MCRGRGLWRCVRRRVLGSAGAARGAGLRFSELA